MYDSGLTLLETLVGLAIVAGLLTISVPYLKREPSGIEYAARQVATQLRLAQSAAIRTSRATDVTIDVAEGRVGRERVASPIALSLLTAAELRHSKTSGSIRFYPDGGATGGGIALIEGTRRVDVLVDWLTGRVSTAESER